ncbi:hypothetical protein I4I65_01105 [Xanthomonas campestris pv. campestris]|nr:hypothetical protein [Xanthomonas campestris pv. campestris]
MLAIALAVRQEAGHAFARHQAQVVHLETGEFIAAEAAPEAEQQQGAIAQMPQFCGAIAARVGRSRSVFQPCRDLAQLGELQGRGAFFDARVKSLDALEHLAHHGARVGSTKPCTWCHCASAASRCLSVLIANWPA